MLEDKKYKSGGFMEKKYQIFISSTYKDLKDERRKVQDTILSMYQFPIGMEMFSAGDEEQWEIIQETIDSSDYYVLIIGHKYGSVIEKGEYAGNIYTQKEFRYALNKKIPILAFLIDDNVAVTPDRMEDDVDKRKKLEEFKNEVKEGRMVEWWTSIEDLAGKVSIALTKQINRGKRPGWIRADAIDIIGTQKELVEMNKRIRELSEENEELKKNIEIRKPKFLIKINGDEEIVIPYQSNDLDQSPQKAKDMNKNSIFFQITCKNVGNRKANDINIEIKIPKGLILAQNSKKKQSKSENDGDYFLPSFKNANLPNSQITVVSSSEVTYQENINDNCIFIRIKGLIHTRLYTSDQYMLVATKKGVFEIAVKVICEELETEAIQLFKVTVN